MIKTNVCCYYSGFEPKACNTLTVRTGKDGTSKTGSLRSDVNFEAAKQQKCTWECLEFRSRLGGI